MFSSLGFSPASADVASQVEPCKIQSLDTTTHMRIGWPVDKDSLKSLGKTNFLVLVVDFSDDPQSNLDVEKYKQKMELYTVSSYFNFVSNGLFTPTFTIYPSYVRMPETSKHYGDKLEVDEVVNGEWESHHMTHDAIEAVDSKVKISDFDAAIVVVSGGSSLSGRVALATSQDEGLDLHKSGEIHNTILAGAQAFSTEGIRPWAIIVHEVNHLLGLVDLYLYEADGWWKGKSTGAFGMQGFLRGSSGTDSLGWNRWLRGWMPESRILCVDSPKNLKEIKMSSLNSIESSYEMVVIKVSPTVVYVVEALKNKGFEASTFSNSLLIYKVDVTVKTGFGPVTIVPKKTKVTTAPLSAGLPDWVRFQEAPLRVFEQVFSEGMLFRNTNYESGALTFSLFTGGSALSEQKRLPKTITCKTGKKVFKIKGYSPTCTN
jgi:M6 family metalloprotease-like protein